MITQEGHWSNSWSPKTRASGVLMSQGRKGRLFQFLKRREREGGREKGRDLIFLSSASWCDASQLDGSCPHRRLIFPTLFTNLHINTLWKYPTDSISRITALQVL
jgi:hypothetical protein